jgi:glycosyltransferase involved in cell wall biosynthesis
VRDGWNGLLVPPRNTKALATAILQLLKSKDERDLMGMRSALHVRENFGLTQVADTYASIYYRVLGLLHSKEQVSKSVIEKTST